MQNIIRWGIIGCGDVTEVKSGPAFQHAAGSELVAVMRRDAAKAEDYARRHQVSRWYSKAEDLLADPQVDAVYVATPPGSHLQYALAACAAGKPAYVEKPMARHQPECQRMVQAFAARNLPLFVAYYRRALPRFVEARNLIASGCLGQVTSVSCRFSAPRAVPRTHNEKTPWRLVAEHSGGGLFLDLASHTLDILDFLFGPLQAVDGLAGNLGGGEVEDAVTMHFRLPGGALGAATWNFVAFQREDTIQITGPAGRLTLSTFGNEPLELETAAGKELLDRPNPAHIQQPLIQSIVDELRGVSGARCPSTGQSAARTSAVMDSVLHDYYGGREDAFWERPGTWARCPGLEQVAVNCVPVSRTNPT